MEDSEPNLHFLPNTSQQFGEWHPGARYSEAAKKAVLAENQHLLLHAQELRICLRQARLEVWLMRCGAEESLKDALPPLFRSHRPFPSPVPIE